MALTHYAGNYITGLTADTKPLNVSDGARFQELDGDKRYFVKIDGAWEDRTPSLGGGIELTTEITGDTTLTAAHANKYIPVNSATAVNITIDESVFAVNNQIVLEQTGAGVVTLVAGAGMTLNGGLNSMDQYHILSVFCKSASVATVIGGEI